MTEPRMTDKELDALEALMKKAALGGERSGAMNRAILALRNTAPALLASARREARLEELLCLVQLEFSMHSRPSINWLRDDIAKELNVYAVSDSSAAGPNAQKWCSWCKKSDHNDSECWCTRPVPDAQPTRDGPELPDSGGAVEQLPDVQPTPVIHPDCAKYGCSNKPHLGSFSVCKEGQCERVNDAQPTPTDAEAIEAEQLAEAEAQPTPRTFELRCKDYDVSSAQALIEVITEILESHEELERALAAKTAELAVANEQRDNERIALLRRARAAEQRLAAAKAFVGQVARGEVCLDTIAEEAEAALAGKEGES